MAQTLAELRQQFHNYLCERLAQNDPTLTLVDYRSGRFDRPDEEDPRRLARTSLAANTPVRLLLLDVQNISSQGAMALAKVVLESSESLQLLKA
jgi:hypothetical protein